MITFIDEIMFMPRAETTASENAAASAVCWRPSRWFTVWLIDDE